MGGGLLACLSLCSQAPVLLPHSPQGCSALDALGEWARRQWQLAGMRAWVLEVLGDRAEPAPGW